MEILAKIRTQADLDALKSAKAELSQARDELQELGADTAAVDRQIDELNAALDTEQASAVRAAAGLEHVQDSLRKVGLDSTAATKRLKELRAKYDLPKRGLFGKAGAELKQFLDSTPGVGAFTRTLGKNTLSITAWAAAAVGAFATAKRGLEEFSQTEQAVADLDQALANNGALTEANREKFQRLAGEMQGATAVADNEWYEALTRLAKLKIPTEEFDRYLEAAKNLSGITGDDIPESVKKLGEAMAGQFDTLQNYGIVVDRNASVTEQMDSIMRQAADKGAGILEARSKSLLGQWNRLKNSTSDLLKGFGNLIARTGLLQGAINLLNGSVKLLQRIFPSTIDSVEGMSNKLPKLTLNADRAAGALDELGDSVPNDFGSEGLVEATGQIDEQTNALRRLQSERDQLGSAQLRADLAAINLQEAQAPETAENQERFEQARRAVRRRAEQRRLDDESFALEQDRDAADEQLASALEQLRRAQEQNASELEQLRGRRDGARAAAGGFADQFATTDEATEYFTSQIAAADQAARRSRADFADDGAGNVDALTAEGRRDQERLEFLRRSFDAFSDFARAEAALRAGTDRSRLTENEATSRVSRAQVAVNQLESRGQAVAARRRALELASATQSVEDRRSTNRARIEDARAAAAASAEALRTGVVNARDRNVSEAARRRAEQQARDFDRLAERADSALSRNGDVMARVAAQLASNQELMQRRFEQLEQRLANAESRSAGNR